MNDDKIQTIIFILAFIGALISVMYVVTHPVTYTGLTPHQQALSQRIIYPQVR